MSDQCKHGVLFPHECSECKNEVTNEDVLRARIADLERELTEQARLNGMGSEREASLMAKVERLERENAVTEAERQRLMTKWGHAIGELDNLRHERNVLQKICAERSDELAAAQATIQRKDDALQTCEKRQIVKEIGPSVTYKYYDSEKVAEALALPADRTALDAILAENAAMMAELFNRMTVEQLKAVPAEMAKRIGEFMHQQGYRLVFDRWYKQAPADAIRQAAERSDK